MENAFKSFCAFGAGGGGGGSVATPKPMMGNAKFAKFSRDMKLVDKNLTSTDVDIIFSKVKNKNEQKISYEQFKVALKLMAEKKYPDFTDTTEGEGGLEKLEKLITDGCGPKTSKTTKPVKNNVVDRLTDASKYTGSHKERFDETGKGKGLSGRRDDDTRAREGYVPGYKDMDTYDAKK